MILTFLRSVAAYPCKAQAFMPDQAAAFGGISIVLRVTTNAY